MCTAMFLQAAGINRYLEEHGLNGYVIHIGTDGAASVCHVTGHSKSFTARFMAHGDDKPGEGATGTWCVAHRFALVFQDALLALYDADWRELSGADGNPIKKAAALDSLPLIKLMRRLVTFYKSSAKMYPQLAKCIAGLELEEAMDVVGINGIELKLEAYTSIRWGSLAKACAKLDKLADTIISKHIVLLPHCKTPRPQ